MPRHKKWALLVLRVALGAILLVHGALKLFGEGSVATFADMFAQGGVPLAFLVAWLAALIEFVGGAFLVIGLLVRWASLLVALEFIVIHLLKWFLWRTPFIGGWEFDLLILASALTLLLHDSDQWSLHHVIWHREAVLAPRASEKPPQDVSVTSEGSVAKPRRKTRKR